MNKWSSLTPVKFRNEKFAQSAFSNNVGSAIGNGFYYRVLFGGGAEYIYIPFDTGTSADRTANPSQISYTFEQIEAVQLVVRRTSNSAIVDTKTIYNSGSDRWYIGSFYGVLVNGTSYDYYYNRKRYGYSWEGETKAFTRTYNGSSYTPSLSFNASNNSVSKNSTYTQSTDINVLSIVANSDYSRFNSYPREVRTLLYEACVQSTEYSDILGKIGNMMSQNKDMFNGTSWTSPNSFPSEGFLYKWDNVEWGGTIDIKVQFLSTTYQSYFNTAINNWISDVNSIFGRTVFIRNDACTSTIYKIDVKIGSHQSLWGYNPDSSTGETMIYYGSWQNNSLWTYDWTPATYEVKLCNELRAAMCNPAYFKNIVYEELTECMGCGNDQFRNYYSMFSEIWYVGKDNKLKNSNGKLSQDGQVLELLYSSYLTQGMTARQLIDVLTPASSGCISLERGNTLDFLTPGKSYNLKIFALHRPVSWSGNTWYWYDTNCNFSNISSEQSITIPSNRPSYFSWTLPKNKGQPFNLTASEWLSLQSNINQVRVARGLSALSFTTPYTTNTFLASMYNECGNAIKGISGYGAYIPNVSSGNTITGYNTSSDVGNMNIIVNELNNVP